MSDSPMVLVVDDEESYIEALSLGLVREGFRISVARTGPEALAQFAAVAPDLVLLDVMLPGMSGVDVCRSIRATSRTPIVMVTAKTSEIDVVVGLEVGADDYVTKPYRVRELVARLRAVLRRVSPERGATDELSHDSIEVIAIGPVTLDSDRHTVTVNGAEVSLPLKEFDLLQMLMENAGRVLTREQLLDRVWGFDYEGDGKTLDVHIKRLRGRIEEDPASPHRITTIRGLGYRYERA